MSILLGFPILFGLLMLQVAVVDSIPLLHGTGDLILLALIAWAVQDRVPVILDWALIGGVLVGVISHLPFAVPLLGYLAVTWMARTLSRQVWQTPLLAMTLASYVGTIVYHVFIWMVLFIQGTPLPVAESLNLVVLPAALLNLILALPVFSMVSDLAVMLYPEEAENEPTH